MDKQKMTQLCPECGSTMRFEEGNDVLSHKGHVKTIQSLGWWCRECGEGILSGKALVAHEKAFLEFKADIDGVLGPAEVAAVRQRLGLSQRKAGELLGGGPRSFQKYEIGTQAVSAPMSNLLRLLGNDPSRLSELGLMRLADSVDKGAAARAYREGTLEALKKQPAKRKKKRGNGTKKK